MIVGEATVTVPQSPIAVFEFVLDLERYKQADHKIGRIGAVERDGDRGSARFSGRLRGIPGPSGTYPFTLSGSRLEFGAPTAGLVRLLLADFQGSFECEETDDGTVVTHREVFEFRRPWRWLMEPYLRKWLSGDTAQEMVRLAELLRS